MKLLFRVLIALYSLFSMIICALVLGLSVFKKPFLDKSLQFAAKELNIPLLESNWIWFWIVLFSVGWLLINLYVFITGLNGGREKGAIVNQTAVGIIKISANTFENITLNVIRRIVGIRDARAYVKINDNDVEISVRAVFLSDVNIPLLSEEAQNRIKQTIETSTGVVVSNVTVLVDSVYTVYKGRVE